MHVTKTTADLQQLILQMENQKSLEWLLLKAEMRNTYEKARPFNLLKKGIREVTTSPEFKDNIIGTAVGMATGLLSKTIIVGSSHNPLKKILGSVLQVVVTNSIARHPETIHSLMTRISDFLSKKKEDKAETQSSKQQ